MKKLFLTKMTEISPSPLLKEANHIVSCVYCLFISVCFMYLDVRNTIFDEADKGLHNCMKKQVERHHDNDKDYYNIIEDLSVLS